MSDFTKSEIDFIEECYIQRMFLEQSEQLHDEFYQCIVAFEEYRKWTHPSLRQAMNTMMYRNASCLHPVLQEIHDVLYANDPFDQRTFNLYISMWAQTIKNGGRYMIDVYDTVVAEKWCASGGRVAHLPYSAANVGNQSYPATPVLFFDEWDVFFDVIPSRSACNANQYTFCKRSNNSPHDDLLDVDGIYITCLTDAIW